MVHSQAALPELHGRVNDLAGILPDATERGLEARLAALETDTGAQLVVLTLQSLNGEPIEDFGIRLAEAWRVGREGIDDGAILIVAVEDRQLRIEVGYGLEAGLTDLRAKQIIADTITPRFRAGDFPGGIDAGVTALEHVLRDEPLPAPAAGIDDPATRSLFLGIFMLVAWIVSTLGINGPGPIAWSIYAILTPFWLVFPSVALGPGWGLVAMLAWLIVFPMLRLGWGRTLRTGGRGGAGPAAFGGGPGPFGGRSGGGGSGGGFGGGFSGGGGSFGGGGASGGW